MIFCKWIQQMFLKVYINVCGFYFLGAIAAIAVIQIIKICKFRNSAIIERERLAQLGEVTAGIIHNLRTPVMSLSGSLEELKTL